MKITIIGSGWIGTPLAEHLHSLGNEVSVTYRTNTPILSADIAAFRTEDQTEAYNRSISEADYIVFAFPPPRTGSKSHAEVCFEAAASANDNCKFVFTSTTGIYPNENRSFDENEDLSSAPNKHLETENALRAKWQNRLTIIRFAGLVGGNRFPVKNMSASGKTYNSEETVNLIHLKDVLGIITFVIEEKPPVILLNACAPDHPKKGEYYTWMAKELGIDPPLFEKGPTGKLIRSDLSVSLGYIYHFVNPFDFFGN
jgi:nucleoside-diphosphate-sugar epimerase